MFCVHDYININREITKPQIIIFPNLGIVDVAITD
jgi:hypothetical protein